MEDVNLWIIVGLALDGIGALLVVVPDMPPSVRAFAYKVTPVIRGYHRSESALLYGWPGSGQVTDPKELRRHFSRLWPLIRDVFDSVDNFGEIGHVKWQDQGPSPIPEGITRSRLQVFLHGGEDTLTVGTGDLMDRISNYKTRFYRTSGGSFLVLGFALQIVGQFYG